jgi:hypothetical protein
MKPIITAFTAATVACILPLAAQGNKPGTDTRPGTDNRTGTGTGTRTDTGTGTRTDTGTGTRTDTETSRNADGSVTETTTTTTFNPEARTKVVKFFETHKNSPHGLPPGMATRIKAKEIPMACRTSRITPGVVLQEEQREHLAEAPQDLVKILPSAPSGVKYYIAGSNVVAVETKSYRIVDSVQIPTIQIRADD